MNELVCESLIVLDLEIAARSFASLFLDATASLCKEQM